MGLRAVFFGTPEFAARSLAAMLDAGIRVPLVVTQPDRPVGRHATPSPSPVARLAHRSGIPLEKPDRLKGNQEFLERIRGAEPDVGVIVAFGRILPKELLEIPRLGFVNVHASLLPKFRGASPVAAAILAGERETGVATMKVVDELDAGPVYLVRSTPIAPEEDAGTLSRRLAEIGARLLVETLHGLAAGTLEPIPQAGEPSFCRTIRRDDGLIDWTDPADDLVRKLRAYTPWPGLFTFLGEDRIKILEARRGPDRRGLDPGAFWTEDGDLLAAAGEGSSVRLLSLQRAGRSPVRGADFALGVRVPGRFGRGPS